MNDYFVIALTGLLTLAAGLPFVIAFDKARKQMEAEDRQNEKKE